MILISGGVKRNAKKSSRLTTLNIKYFFYDLNF